MFGSPRRWILIISPLITLSLLYYVFRAPNANPVPSIVESSKPAPQSDPQPLVVQQGKTAPAQSEANFGPRISEQEARCGHLERDLEDVLVIVKTGATESQEKIPVQLRTGLRCVPHYVIFSDYEEKIDGVQVYDVLKNVTEETTRNQPEFQLYQKLQKVGREGLTKEDWGDHSNGPYGKENNPGWKLDKWKFLPMMDGALEVKPDAKWFIFIESDTYMVWQNLVNWLAHLDHTRSYYLGSPMQQDQMLFGYGGSGVILSSKAMGRLHAHWTEAQDELEQMTATEWAGDCVLARALEATHIYLTWAWPMMMTMRPWEVDHFSEQYQKQPWCYPVISYHHMDAHDIEAMWEFERGWFRSGKNALLLHADVYREFIHNDTLSYLDSWDNLSGAEIVFEEPTVPSVAACADACTQNQECLQYAYNHSQKKCRHSATTVTGVESTGISSGWMTHRVKRLLKNFQSSCPQVEYIFD